MSTMFQHGHSERGSSAPDDLSMIVEMRQTQLLENAFPADTALTLEQRDAIVREVPPLEPGGALARLEFFGNNGQMNSLDLDRTELNPVTIGDWSISDELDNEISEMLHLIAADQALRHSMGLVALDGLGVIEKGDRRAEIESSVTNLGEKSLEDGYVAVTRRRMVGAFVIAASGQPIVVRKVSDFRLSLDESLYETSHQRAFRWVVLNQINNRSLLNYGTANESMEALRKNISAGIETAITERRRYLEPVAVSYHVARTNKFPGTLPLQRPSAES